MHTIPSFLYRYSFKTLYELGFRSFTGNYRKVSKNEKLRHIHTAGIVRKLVTYLKTILS